MKQPQRYQKYMAYGIGLLLLVVGFTAGYALQGALAAQPTVVTQNTANSTRPASAASAQQIEQAKNQIAELYKDRAVKACWTVNNGSNLAAGKYSLTYRNIQINTRLDRAIITDCAENSTLLARNSQGTWAATSVNITNFNRVNPQWQAACHIEDISVADDKARPENQYIDQVNLEKCQQLDNQ